MDTEKISDWNIDPEDTELSLEDIEEVFQDTDAEEAAEENTEPEDQRLSDQQRRYHRHDRAGYLYGNDEQEFLYSQQLP